MPSTPLLQTCKGGQTAKRRSVLMRGGTVKHEFGMSWLCPQTILAVFNFCYLDFWDGRLAESATTRS